MIAGIKATPHKDRLTALHGIASVAAATIIVANVDPWLLLFIVPMVAVSMFFGKKCGDLYYKLDFSNTRDGRVGSYVKRVFYEKKYAGELRLFGMGKLLLSRHEKAYEEMSRRTAEIRKKVALLETLKWVIYQAVILISHRLSTTKDADRIILLENGTVAESGTHAELLAKGGTYAKMWNVQAEKYCTAIYA